MKASRDKTEETLVPPERRTPEHTWTWLERAEWFFTFLVFFAGFFYLTSEARTQAQLYFRLGSIVVGVAGWMVVQVLKRRRTR